MENNENNINISYQENLNDNIYKDNNIPIANINDNYFIPNSNSNSKSKDENFSNKNNYYNLK